MSICRRYIHYACYRLIIWQKLSWHQVPNIVSSKIMSYYVFACSCVYSVQQTLVHPSSNLHPYSTIHQCTSTRYIPHPSNDLKPSLQWLTIYPIPIGIVITVVHSFHGMHLCAVSTKQPPGITPTDSLPSIKWHTIDPIYTGPRWPCCCWPTTVVVYVCCVLHLTPLKHH